jgi:hypothetical protein
MAATTATTTTVSETHLVHDSRFFFSLVAARSALSSAMNSFSSLIPFEAHS